jgi:antirestriction protein ArdC
MLQRPDATRVAGYRTWQGLGRQVRKGERGIAVLAPVTYRRQDEDAEGDQPQPGDDQQVPRQVRGWKIEHVFDVAQTDGEPLADVRPQLVEGEAPSGLWDALADQITAAGFGLVREAVEGSPSALGSTDFLTKTVRVRPDVSPAQAIKTEAHELAHILLEHGPSDCTDPRSRREVEAESVAFVVCRAAGLDTSCYSLAYVGGWAPEGKEAEEVTATADRVVTVARQITVGLPGSLVVL